jgi:hypothetical protein
MEIMGPQHSEWHKFRRLLREQLWEAGKSNKCPLMRSKPLASWILKNHFPGIDVPATLKFFETKGGYCDCEVLLNVN